MEKKIRMLFIVGVSLLIVIGFTVATFKIVTNVYKQTKYEIGIKETIASKVVKRLNQEQEKEQIYLIERVINIISGKHGMGIDDFEILIEKSKRETKKMSDDVCWYIKFEDDSEIFVIEGERRKIINFAEELN